MTGYVLVTGATSGIGNAFAREYAKQGKNLILTGRDGKVLESLKKQLLKTYGVQVLTIALDFSKGGATEELHQFTKQNKCKVDLLINNAGFGYVGKFLDETEENVSQMHKVNMEVLTSLCLLYGRDMAKNGGGKIINIASTGAYHPGAYTSVYYATKAYVLSLTEALAIEWKNTGVTIHAVCPGATRTNFSKRAGRKENPFAVSPEYIVKQTLKGLRRRRVTIVPGIVYKFLVRLPRKIGATLIARQQKNMAVYIDN